MDLLLGPQRLAGQYLGQGRDAIANAFAAALGARRPDPNANASAAQPALDRSRDTAESAYRATMDTMRRGATGARSGIVGALGWQDALPTASAAPAPAAGPLAASMGLPPGWDEDMPQGFTQGARAAPARAMTPGRAAGPRRVAAPLSAPPVSRSYGPYPEDDARDAEALGGTAAMAEAPTDPAAQMPARRDMAGEYRQRVGQLPQRATGATDKDKNSALLEASLAILAAASRPGASALGAVGEGGLRGTAALRESEKVNREDARDRRREDREDLRTEFTLADKDQDNARGDVREARADRRERALEELNKQGLEIQKQYKEGLITQKQAELQIREAQAAAQREIGLAKLDAAHARITAAQDREPAELRVLRALQADPRLRDVYKEVKGDKTGKTTFDEGDIAQMYRDSVKAAASSPLAEHPGTFEQFRSRLQGTGGPPKPASEADAHKQAKDALKKGADKGAINRRLQEWGYKPL
jgi:hypothetical protein